MSWWWWDPQPKFARKRDQGIVLYTKPKYEFIRFFINEFIRSFIKTILIRRLQTKRVQTHREK